MAIRRSRRRSSTGWRFIYVSGTISAVRGQVDVAGAAVPSTGLFTLRLPPGTYLLRATRPPTDELTCPDTVMVDVRANAAVSVTVLCP